MTTEPHFDLCQFDRVMQSGQKDELPRELYGGEQAGGFHGTKSREITHAVPDWALSWNGLARVALCSGGLTVRRGHGITPAHHARKVSALYLYFRVGMASSHIAEYLDMTVNSVEMMVRNVRKSFPGDSVQTIYGETAQLRHAVKRFMQDREKDPLGTPPAKVSGVGPGLALPLETPAETKAKRAEREQEPEVWNEVRMKGLAALGANLRARRRSQWKTSDTPHKFTLPMRANFGRKIHRAARVQLKAKALRRLDDINLDVPRLPSRRCRHGIYGADTCSVCLVLPDSVV